MVRGILLLMPSSDTITDACEALAGLSAEQRAFALRSEAMWRRAREGASGNPGVDAGDIFHALLCLELTPTERLRRGLARGRLRAYAR